MSACPHCGALPMPGQTRGLCDHDCHCLRVDGERVAVGICCGRMLGAELLAAEDESDARTKKPATFHRRGPP